MGKLGGSRLLARARVGAVLAPAFVARPVRERGALSRFRLLYVVVDGVAGPSAGMSLEEKGLWILVLSFLIVYSVPSQRQENYLLPSVPALAVLIAMRWRYDRTPVGCARLAVPALVALGVADAARARDARRMCCRRGATRRGSWRCPRSRSLVGIVRCSLRPALGVTALSSRWCSSTFLVDRVRDRAVRRRGRPVRSGSRRGVPRAGGSMYPRASSGVTSGIGFCCRGRVSRAMIRLDTEAAVTLLEQGRIVVLASRARRGGDRTVPSDGPPARSHVAGTRSRRCGGSAIRVASSTCW